MQCSCCSRLFNSGGFADARQMMRQEENGGRRRLQAARLRMCGKTMKVEPCDSVTRESC